MPGFDERDVRSLPTAAVRPSCASGHLRSAGFHEVDTRTVIIPAPWPGTPDEYWQHFYDVAVPLRPLFDSLQPEQFQQARAEAVDLLGANYDGSVVQTTVAIVVASGMR